MKFTDAQIEAFFAASRDANPLHRDAAYSRRTPFGRPVVYGMAAVLQALGEWGAGQPFRLRSLQVEFRKPLFVGEHYEMAVRSSAGRERIRIGKGPVDYAVISFAAQRGSPVPTPAPVRQDVRSGMRDAPAEQPETSARRVCYSIAMDALPALEAAFGAGAKTLPLRQLAALLWASYHVGMEMPGRQALFAQLQMEFEDVGSDGPDLTIDLGEAVFDDRFNRYTVSGSAQGIRRLSIAAYKRPLPVDVTLQSLARFDDTDPPLRSRKVFISGATRGFGAVLARSCFLAGAQLALNYRGDPHAAVALRTELESAGGDARIFQGSADDAEAMQAMARDIAASLGGLDLIVNNPAPPIHELQFLEQDNQAIQAFCAQNLAITLETVRHLLPLLRPGGQFLHVSTRYLAEPARGFTHYLAAKAAQEGLIRGLAAEFRDTEFVVARLPRILTDQTNMPFSFESTEDPAGVAHALILALRQRGPGNFRLLEMY